MQRVADGDARAFRQIADEHLPAILTYLTRLMRNEADAQDVAQETFVRVWTKASDYKPKARITTWIHAIARNLAIDRMRALTRRGTRVDFDDDLEQARPSERPPELLERKWTSESVLRAISALPERQQSALLLAHEQGLAQHEIAVVLSTSVEAVESLLKRARNSLREALYYLDHEPSDHESNPS